jgi:WD40 repeat protein
LSDHLSCRGNNPEERTWGFDLRFSPDEKVLALADEDVRLFDVASGKLLRRFSWKSAKQITTIAFSADGKLLAAASPLHEAGRLWCQDWRTGKEILTHKLDASNHLVFAPQKPLLAGAGEDGSLFLLDVASGKWLWRRRESCPVRRLAFSPDGKVLIGGRKDGFLVQIDIATGKAVRSWPAHGEAVSALAFQRDGKRLASGGAEGLVRIWDPATARDVHSFPGHREKVREVACSPDGHRVLSAGFDSSVRLWDVTSGRQLLCFRGRVLARSLCFSANGKVCAWQMDGRPYWLPLDQTKPRIGGDEGADVRELALSPDGREVVSLDFDCRVHIWQPATETRARLHTFSQRFEFASGHGEGVSPHSSMVGGQRGDGRVFLYNVQEDKEVVLRLHAPWPPGIFRFNAEGSKLLSYGGRRPGPQRVEAWDLRTAKVLAFGRVMSHAPEGAAFSRTGRLFAQVSEGSIEVYETASNTLVREIKAKGVFPHCVAFMPDSRRLITGNDDSTLLMWGLHHPRAGKASRTLAQLWQQLASLEGGPAYEALWEMTVAGDDAVAFLQDRLRPVQPVDAKRLKRLLAGLDDDSFSVRQDLEQELAPNGFSPDNC